MKLKKLLSVFIALALLLSLVSVPAFADGDKAKIGNVGYASLEAAVDAAQNGDTIVLLDDITYGTDHSVAVWEVKEFNLDLNGHTVTTNANANSWSSSAICYGDYAVVSPARDVTISSGTVRTAYGTGIYGSDAVTMTLSGLDVRSNTTGTLGETEYSSAIRLTYNATAIIENGTYEGYNAIAVSNSGGTAIVNGGSFNGRIHFSKNTDTNHPTVKAITINGGNFTNCSFVNPNKGTLTITGGTFDCDPSAYVADGCKVIANSNGTYTVESRYVAQIGSDKYETLSAAVAALEAGDTIELLADIDFSSDTYKDYKWAGSTYNPLTITKSNVTIDLAGHTISNMGNAAIALGNLLAVDGRIENITVKNGTLLAGKTDNVTNSYVLGIAGVDGALIKNVTTNGGINVYTGSKDVVIDSCNVNGTKYYTVCAQCGSDVTIKGTTYTKNTDSSVAAKAMFWVDGAGSDSDVRTPENPTGAYGASSIIIESGNFTVSFANGGVFKLGSGLKPVVKGGTFNFDPTAYVAEGYEAVSNGDGTWTVGEVKAGELTQTETTEGFDATYTATKQVVDENDGVISAGTNRTINVKVDTVTDASENTANQIMNNLSMDKVLDSVVASVADTNDTVNVEIKVTSDSPSLDAVSNTITYEIHPEATVFVNDTKVTSVAISNDDLADNAEFTIKLHVPDEIADASNGNIKVTHRSAGYEDDTRVYSLQGTAGNYYVQLTVTHFSDFVVAANGSLFSGHSVTLNGYINLNFYLNLSADQVTTGSGAVVNFTWDRGSASHTVALGDYVSGRGYKATVALPAAEMSYDVTATVEINGSEQLETSTYSVRDYGIAVLAGDGSTELKNLVNAMLDYGAKAQTAFGRTDVSYANDGIAYTMPDVTREELLDLIDQAIIDANNGMHATVVRDVAEAIGAESYYSSSLIYLSGCTLRHYFYGYGLDETKFTGVKQDYYYYVDKENIAAADLDKLQAFTIGDLTFHYSALDFVKAIIYNYTEGANYDLAAATYWYNQAANAYFE